jgi:DNA primase
MADLDPILARVTIRNILAEAGYHPARNRMPCPIHDGNNRTAFAFTDSTFVCFSCDAKGGLLDLVEYLYHCTRQDALRHLCKMAGIPFDETESDSQPRSRMRSLPYRIDPLIEDDEYRAAKNRLE